MGNVPLPKPKPDEKEDDFISRCVPIVMDEADDREQAVAICHTQFRGKSMTPNEKLLAAVRQRGQKQTEFGHGIQTADVYVRTLAEQFGLDTCYKYVANRKTSFDDLVQKAGRTLVYSNPDMVIEEKDVDAIRKIHDVELPKNTLMVFKHTLTTSTKDRDGDVLHADGARPDPNMLLLWQHLHTMPIGKAIAIADQTDQHLKMISCIVDINETSHDAAVMIDNDMGRFSHGFRALDFEEIKEGDKKRPTGAFDIKEFEIMEESLVSVPANIDSTTEEIMLSLVEGGKLTSPMMKEYGKILREKRPVRLPVTFREIHCNSFDELKQAHDAGLIAGATGEKNNERTDGKSTGAGVGAAGTSKETNAETDDKGLVDGGKEEGSDTEITCPKCDGEIKGSKCSECDYAMAKLDKGEHPFGKEGENQEEEGDEKPKPKPKRKPKRKPKPGEEKPDDENMGKSAVLDEKFYAPLSDSYEWIREELQPQVQKLLATGEDDYCWIEATFADYVIVRKNMGMNIGEYFYRVSWKMEDGKPMLEGEAKEVDIEPARVLAPKSFGAKAGRAISKANEVRLQDAVDDLKEVSGMDIARPAKALVKSATGTLISVLKQIEKPDTLEDDDSAMTMLIASASPAERKQMKEVLELLEKSKQRAEYVKQYRVFRGKRKTRQA